MQVNAIPISTAQAGPVATASATASSFSATLASSMPSAEQRNVQNRSADETHGMSAISNLKVGPKLAKQTDGKTGKTDSISPPAAILGLITAYKSTLRSANRGGNSASSADSSSQNSKPTAKPDAKSTTSSVPAADSALVVPVTTLLNTIAPSVATAPTPSTGPSIAAPGPSVTDLLLNQQGSNAQPVVAQSAAILADLSPGPPILQSVAPSAPVVTSSPTSLFRTESEGFGQPRSAAPGSATGTASAPFVAVFEKPGAFTPVPNDFSIPVSATLTILAAAPVNAAPSPAAPTTATPFNAAPSAQATSPALAEVGFGPSTTDGESFPAVNVQAQNSTAAILSSTSPAATVLPVSVLPSLALPSLAPPSLVPPSLVTTPASTTLAVSAPTRRDLPSVKLSAVHQDDPLMPPDSVSPTTSGIASSTVANSSGPPDYGGFNGSTPGATVIASPAVQSVPVPTELSSPAGPPPATPETRVPAAPPTVNFSDQTAIVSSNNSVAVPVGNPILNNSSAPVSTPTLVPSTTVIQVEHPAFSDNIALPVAPPSTGLQAQQLAMPASSKLQSDNLPPGNLVSVNCTPSDANAAGPSTISYAGTVDTSSTQSVSSKTATTAAVTASAQESDIAVANNDGDNIAVNVEAVFSGLKPALNGSAPAPVVPANTLSNDGKRAGTAPPAVTEAPRSSSILAAQTAAPPEKNSGIASADSTAAPSILDNPTVIPNSKPVPNSNVVPNSNIIPTPNLADNSSAAPNSNPGAPIATPKNDASGSGTLNLSVETVSTAATQAITADKKSLGAVQSNIAASHQAPTLIAAENSPSAALAPTVTPLAAAPSQAISDQEPELPKSHQMLDSAPPALPIAPTATGPTTDAQMNSQMHVGVHSDAFGAVEIHTVIQQSQVGISVHSDRDISRWFSSEVPSLESGLNKSYLNLIAVDFDHGVQTATSFQHGQQRQSFSQNSGSQHTVSLHADSSGKNATRESATSDILPSDQPVGSAITHMSIHA